MTKLCAKVARALDETNSGVINGAFQDRRRNRAHWQHRFVSSGESSTGYERSRRAATNAELRSRPAPLDPSRKVAEQDCSKPIDLYSGNIRCK
jgi:hypothetical protein